MVPFWEEWNANGTICCSMGWYNFVERIKVPPRGSETVPFFLKVER